MQLFLQRKTNKERVSDQKWNEIRVLVRDLTGQVPNKVFSGVAIQLHAFKAILNLIYSYVHMKPPLTMFMKGNEVTLTGQNPPLKCC